MSNPTDALIIQDPTNINWQNSETYIHYYNKLMLMLTSMFEWKNLPDDIPERFIEKVLFNEGQIAFFEDGSTGYKMMRCMQHGELNLYDEPTEWEVYTTNGARISKTPDELEIIRNNKFAYPSVILLQHHLHRLHNIERTIDQNLWQQRNLVIIKSKENQRLTIKNLMKEIVNFGYMIFGSDKLDTKGIESLNFNIPFIGIDLEQMKEIKWNECINMFGINSANTTKKERLITDEANANNQLIQLNVDVMLTERKIAVDRINKRYGLNIEVNFRENLEKSLGMEVNNSGEMHNGTQGNSEQE